MCLSSVVADFALSLFAVARRNYNNFADGDIRNDMYKRHCQVLHEDVINDIMSAAKEVLFPALLRREQQATLFEGLLPRGAGRVAAFQGLMCGFDSKCHREDEECEWEISSAYGMGKEGDEERAYYEHDHYEAGFVFPSLHGGKGVALPNSRTGVMYFWRAMKFRHGTGYWTGEDQELRLRGGSSLGGCTARKTAAQRIAIRRRAGLEAAYEQQMAMNDGDDENLQIGNGQGGPEQVDIQPGVAPGGVAGFPLGVFMV